MRPSPAWRLAALVCVTGVTGAAAATALWALSGNGGPFAISSIAGFAQAHDARAFKLLQGRPSRDAAKAATAEIETALALSPYSNAARLRLVYVETQQNARVTPRALRLLEQSYELLPYDYTVAAWRTRFALEHWTEMSLQIRSAARSEAIAFLPRAAQDVGMAGVLRSIRNPAGRLAAALWMREPRT